MAETGSDDTLLFSLAQMARHRGDAFSVAVLSDALVDQKSECYDNWNGGMYHVSLRLEVDAQLYATLTPEDRERICQFVRSEAEPLLALTENEDLSSVGIFPRPQSVPNGWREEGKAWLRGKNINNQARVRSNNPAPIEQDGLHFRSPPEVRLYKALKARSLTFAPLPVFIRGGKSYHRLEPDFLIIKDGIVYQIEVDGNTVHRESPADAQKRVAPLEFEGVKIYRILSSDIANDEEAAKRVDAIIKWIDKMKQNQR